MQFPRDSIVARGGGPTDQLQRTMTVFFAPSAFCDRVALHGFEQTVVIGSHVIRNIAVIAEFNG